MMSSLSRGRTRGANGRRRTTPRLPVTIALVALTLCTGVRADSWRFPAELTTKTFSFGATKFVLTTDARANQRLPQYSVAVYADDKQLALYPGIAFEALYSSPNNEIFVGLSNTGLPGTAVVVFDASGAIRLLATHGMAEFDYCDRSVTLVRTWYDAESPQLDFKLDAVDDTFGVYLRDCHGKRIELFRAVMAAYQRAAEKWPVPDR